jgi:DnaJ-class molecular chaperone
MKDYYQILGVPRGSSDSDIKKAYRRLAKQHHPDVNKGEKVAEDRFKDISEAYSVLSNGEKRKQYDMFGSGAFHGGFDPSQASQGFRWSNSEGSGGQRFYTSTNGPGGFEGVGDLGDIFGELFGMGGFTRGAGKKRPSGRRPQAGPRHGGDTYTTFEIDFEEAIAGASKRMSIKRGEAVDTLTVKIPAGVDNGSKVRIKGKGHPGDGGGKPGDLYLNIHVKPHKIFWREGADILVDVPISIYEAVLGGQIEVPTVGGSAKMKIPAGTNSGQKFRLKGKGAPIIGKKGKGDQYAIIQIVPPEKMDEATKKSFKELAQKSPYNPRKS